MKRSRRLQAVIVMLFTLFQVLLCADGETAFTIYYTSSLNGNLDGCRCKSWPRAGLVKRAYYVRGKSEEQNSIIIEAGDFLDVNADNELARHILEIYGELGYDVMAIGDAELSYGYEKLLRYRSKYPLFCHNLSIIDKREGREILFSGEPAICMAGTCKIGIICLLEESTILNNPDTEVYGYRCHLPEETIADMLPELDEKKVDVVLLVFHGHYETLLDFLPHCDGIDVVIVAHEQRLIDGHRVNNTWIYSPGDEGNRVGILEISFEKDGTMKQHNLFRLFHYNTDPDDPLVRKRIREYTKARNDINKQENH